MRENIFKCRAVDIYRIRNKYEKILDQMKNALFWCFEEGKNRKKKRRERGKETRLRVSLLQLQKRYSDIMGFWLCAILTGFNLTVRILKWLLCDGRIEFEPIKANWLD